MHRTLDRATQIVAAHPELVPIAGNVLVALGMVLLEKPAIALDYARYAFESLGETSGDAADGPTHAEALSTR